MGDNDVQKRPNRKRKKTFLQNARGFAKKGSYGRGSDIGSENYEYFVRVLEVFQRGFPSDEEKLLFVKSVFEQIEDNEIKYSSNQIGCRAVETVLPFASNSCLERFMKVLLEDLRPLCSDPYASHVLQKLFEVMCDKSLQQNNDEEFRQLCNNHTLKISKFLLNNLEDYVWDKFGNHIIRTVIESLAQIPPEVKGQKTNTTCTENETTEEYVSIIKDYAQRLMAWPHFKDFPSEEHTSGLLQVLLKALKKTDKNLLKKCIKQLLSDSFTSTTVNDGDKMGNDKQLANVFASKPAVMLLELCLEVAPHKQYTKIYADCFVNNLAHLAKNGETQFSVQKLLKHCTRREEFNAMFEELADSFGDILDAGSSGIILALGQACIRLSTKQSQYVQTLMQCFNCYEPEDRQNSIVLCLCKFVKFEDMIKESVRDLERVKLNLHGTLMVQLMLDFNKPIKIINSILSIETETLKGLFLNGMGCHIVDSFVKSQFVGEKSREKLLKKMRGTHQDLAKAKYGSRTFESLWSIANEKTKLSIMSELSHKDNAWTNSQYGKIIDRKINFQLYKRNAEQWKNFKGQENKTQTLFAKITDK